MILEISTSTGSGIFFASVRMMIICPALTRTDGAACGRESGDKATGCPPAVPPHILAGVLRRSALMSSVRLGKERRAVPSSTMNLVYEFFLGLVPNVNGFTAVTEGIFGNEGIFGFTSGMVPPGPYRPPEICPVQVQ